MARPKRKVNLFLPISAPETSGQRIYKAGGYVRLSVEDSGKTGSDTMEAQAELIRNYIDAQPDMQFADMFCDNGQTGTDFDRPAFVQLMDRIRKKQIDCIVVKDLSRFGRNYIETGYYLEQILPELDVRFVAVSDHFDTLTAERSSDSYIISLKNIINSAYSKDISRKSSTALTVKRQNGEFIGSWAAYGYRKCENNKNRIEPDEETAPVVRSIFQWRLSGMNVFQIVRRLNELGISSPSRHLYQKGCLKAERFANGVWTYHTVKELLTKEVYLGHMVQGRKRSGFCKGQKQKRLLPSEWIIVRNTHEPLIDEETFFAVQELLNNCRKTYNERLGCYDNLGTTPNILRGLVYCADCKRTLIRHKAVVDAKKKAGTGKRVRYVYICRTHSADPTSCPGQYFYETALHEILWEAIQKEIKLAVNMEKLVRQYQRSEKALNRAGKLEREIFAAQQVLDRAEKLYSSLYQNYVDKLLSEQEYMEMKQHYKTSMEQAQTILKMAEKKRQDEKQQVNDNPWLTAFQGFQAESELTEEMVHTLVDRVEIGKNDDVTITMKYHDEYHALVQFLSNAGAKDSI